MSHQLVLPLRVTRDGKLSPFGNLVAEMKVELLAELGKRFLRLANQVFVADADDPVGMLLFGIQTVFDVGLPKMCCLEHGIWSPVEWKERSRNGTTIADDVDEARFRKMMDQVVEDAKILRVVINPDLGGGGTFVLLRIMCDHPLK